MATRAVAGLMMTDSNYDAAVDILRSRFGRKDLIVNAHMWKPLNLTPVKKSSDVSALRQLSNDCEIQVRSLELLRVVSYTYRGMLWQILLEMMDCRAHKQEDGPLLARWRQLGRFVHEHVMKVLQLPVTGQGTLYTFFSSVPTTEWLQLAHCIMPSRKTDREPGRAVEDLRMGSTWPSSSVRHDRDNMHAHSAHRGCIDWQTAACIPGG